MTVVFAPYFLVTQVRKDPSSQLLSTRRYASAQQKFVFVRPCNSDVPETEDMLSDRALEALGYSKPQIYLIKPESKSAILEHHDALTKHGLSHAQICKISRRWQSLGEVANSYTKLVETRVPSPKVNNFGNALSSLFPGHAAFRRYFSTFLVAMVIISPKARSTVALFSDACCY